MRGDYRRVFTERLNSIGPLEILSVARMTVVVKSSANLLAKLSWSERNEQAREELGPKLIQMHEQSCTCACTSLFIDLESKVYIDNLTISH